MSSYKILSLEDDANLCVVMEEYFESQGHSFITVNNGKECLENIQNQNFDIVIMDLGLPDIDGLTLLPQIKQAYAGPVIIVSGKSDTMDRIVGLEMGADDYLAKPFEMRELLARIKANVRRQNQPQDDDAHTTEKFIYHFGDFIFDEGKLTLTHAQKGQIEMTSGECELLQIFLKSKGRALTREYLHEETHNDSYESFDRAIDIAVTRLRKKLNDDPNKPTLIKTIRGVGYMFIAEIKKSPAD